MIISRNTRSEYGFSLIEVLLAVAISMLLIDLIIHLCVGLIKEHVLLREKAVLVENAQLAEFILRREIQTAGFLGCNKINDLDIHYHLRRSYLPIVPLQVFPKDSGFIREIQPESEVILIEKMSEETTKFLLNREKKTIKINFKNHFSLDDPLVISNCKQADVFLPLVIQYDNPFQLTIEAPLNYTSRHALLSKLVATAFFVGKTQRKNRYGKPIHALYSYDLIHHRKIEWISGVNSMEVFGGVYDEDDSTVSFKPISHISDISSVRLIKIILLLTNEDSLFFSQEHLHMRQEIMIYLREIA